MSGKVGSLIAGVALLGVGLADLVLRLHSGQSIDAVDGVLIVSGAGALGVHVQLP